MSTVTSTAARTTISADSAAGQRAHGMPLIAAAGATFLAYLDVTVVNVAIPADRRL